MLPGRARLCEYSLDHKHHSRGGHVAIIAQYCPRFSQGAWRQPKCIFQRRDHLGAPRVTDETVDVVDAQTVTREKLCCDISELCGDEIWNVTRKDRFQAFIGDLPAHHVEAAGPGMLARSDEGRSLPVGRQQRGRGAVAEQSRCDDVALRPVVAPERQRAEFYGKKKHGLAGLDHSLSGAAGKADNPAGTAEAEDRQPLYPASQAHPFDEHRIETRCGDPRSRNNDNLVDVVLVAAAKAEHPPGSGLQEIERRCEINVVALGPAMCAVVPFDRYAGVPPVYSGVQEYRKQAVEIRRSSK